MMRPRLNRRGCAIFAIALLVVIALLVIIERERVPKPESDAFMPFEGSPAADVPRH